MDVTLKDLMSRALHYADSPKDSLDADQKAQLIVDINDGLKELWDAMCDDRQDMVFKTDPTSIAIVSGTESYALPKDFYKAIRVWLVENDRRYKVDKFDLEQVDGYPQPLTAGSIELWYAPTMPLLKKSLDTVPSIIPNGWENYAALFAACRILAAEQTGAGEVGQEKNALLQRIRQVVGSRDEQPDSVGDAYNRFDSSEIRDFVQRELRYRIMGKNIYFVEVELGGV